MLDAYQHIRSLQGSRQRLRQRDAAVLATRAPDGNRDEPFAFPQISISSCAHKGRQVVEELTGAFTR
jgi:hypothetical protein